MFFKYSILKLKLKILLIGFLLFTLNLYSIYAQTFRIYHIDVEQADATLFISPSNKTLLVDCGKNGHGSRIKAIMQEAGVDTINFFVCTHYHEDHYGGIDDLILQENIVVLNSYDRGDKEYLDLSTTDGDTYKGYQNALGETSRHLMRGETIPLDPDISITCISSGGAVLGENNPVPGVDENDMSISLLIQYKGFKYFIGGDIEKPTEQKIADNDLVLNVDVYQADHHGSSTSSTSDFVNDLKPTVIVISNGNNAKYKHPQQSTLDFFAGMNPRPSVFQTNKYLKGGDGGNVNDEFIADLESVDADGTILITVNNSPGDYVVTYRDKIKTFPIKETNVTTSSIVIKSLLPNPVGSDVELEEVILTNKSNYEISMTGWYLKDTQGRVWSLLPTGIINAGQSITISRNGMPMNLNNSGDEIFLIDPNNQIRDHFTYVGSQEGIWIETGH